MDKIAIISDIHGNVTATKAVLDDIKKRNVSKIICLGDLVIKGANPDVAIDIIRENCDVVLKGNCDETISTEKAKMNKYWTTEKIGEERCQYLKNLPISYEFYLSGQLVRLFHASPYGLQDIFNPMYLNKENAYSDCEIKDAKKLFDNTDFIGKKSTDPEPDIIGYGHLHTPNMYKYGNKTIFNVGSVGAPNEMENLGTENRTNSFSTLASYSILEGDLDSKEIGTIAITNIRVVYDIEKEISYLQESDMPYKEKAILCLKTASTNYEEGVEN